MKRKYLVSDIGPNPEARPGYTPSDPGKTERPHAFGLQRKWCLQRALLMAAIVSRGFPEWGRPYENGQNGNLYGRKKLSQMPKFCPLN